LRDETSTGYGIRALFDGAWGFAASADLSEAGVDAAAARAVDIARAGASIATRRFGEAPADAYVDAYATPFERDPASVPLGERVVENSNLCFLKTRLAHDHLAGSRTIVAVGVISQTVWDSPAWSCSDWQLRILRARLRVDLFPEGGIDRGMGLLVRHLGASSKRQLFGHSQLKKQVLPSFLGVICVT